MRLEKSFSSKTVPGYYSNHLEMLFLEPELIHTEEHDEQNQKHHLCVSCNPLIIDNASIDSGSCTNKQKPYKILLNYFLKLQRAWKYISKFCVLKSGEGYCYGK